MEMYLFELVKQMAFNAAFVILIVLCCRGILSRLPRAYSYVLWLVVALRLLCPVMLPSNVSIFGLLGQTDAAVVQQGSQVVSDMTENTLAALPEKTETETEALSAGVWQPAVLGDKETKNQLLFYGWVAGMAAFGAYGFAANLILREKLRYATKLEEKPAADGAAGRKKVRIYESGAIKSPFVYGFAAPKIYLPYHLTEKEREYILAHEQYHIKRKDYLVKALAYLLLCVYWFHPLVWLSYYLMNRDMEISCDEAVMRGKSNTDRENYAALLLSFAAGKREKIFAPLSFGENSTKQRVHYILQEKRKVFAGSFLAVGVIALAAVVCLTDADTSTTPADENSEDNGGAASKEAQLLYEKRNPYVGDASADGALLSAIDEVCGIEFAENISLSMELQTDEEPYTLIMHLTPADGTDYLKWTSAGETNMWKRAVLFLALTENCGEVRWDYETEEGLITTYINVDSAPAEDGVADVKEYGTSPEMLDKLLAGLDVEIQIPIHETIKSGEPETAANETETEEEWVSITLSDGKKGYLNADYLGNEQTDIYFEEATGSSVSAEDFAERIKRIEEEQEILEKRIAETEAQMEEPKLLESGAAGAEDWVEVTLEDGTTGYVKKGYLENDAAESEDWVEVTLKDGITGYVKKEYLDREGLQQQLEQMRKQQAELEAQKKQLEAQKKQLEAQGENSGTKTDIHSASAG